MQPGASATNAAKALESAFLANGVHADAYSKLLFEQVGSSRTFTLLVEGLIRLGLIVGLAALAVISARALIERRL